MGTSGNTYDPSWLVRLAEAQLKERPEFAKALQACTHYVKKTEAMVYFVSPERANEPGSEWQFEENVILESEQHGDLVLDVLKDGRIGGIEFLKYIPGY